jgi:hypothetical protein
MTASVQMNKLILVASLKGLVANTNWLAVNRLSWSNSDSVFNGLIWHMKYVFYSKHGKYHILIFENKKLNMIWEFADYSIFRKKILEWVQLRTAFTGGEQQTAETVNWTHYLALSCKYVQEKTNYWIQHLNQVFHVKHTVYIPRGVRSLIQL